MRVRCRNYTWRIALVAAVVFVPFLLAALWFGPLSGDLTRTGAWSERDFAWSAVQPTMPVYANGAGVRDADVLVLGDSFSMGNVWQSELQRRTGVTTQSFGFDQAPCLEAFVRLALASGNVAARFVVIQTIERSFLDRFEQVRPCAGDAVLPFEVPPGRTHASPLYGRLTVDWRYLARTAANSLRMTLQPEVVIRGPEVVNAPLSTDRLFSNRRAARLLYYAYDDAKAGWSEARIEKAISNLLAIDRRMRAAGKRLLLVVVPDKSTVYREFLLAPLAAVSTPDVSRLLAERGISVVELLGPMRVAARSSVDLYMPNDTHLSSSGFRLLGEDVARWDGFAGGGARPRPGER